jgi:pimeloyl-ACP methyl ester carboxylesterase
VGPFRDHFRPRGVTYNVLVGGPNDSVPVLLVHGNGSSAEFWLPLIRRFPNSVRVVAPHLRGYGRSEAAPVDATRGLRDFADDLAAHSWSWLTESAQSSSDVSR